MILKCKGIHYLMMVFIMSRCSAHEVIPESKSSVSDRADGKQWEAAVGSRVKRQTEELLAEDELAWIVMIFQVKLVAINTTDDESEMEQSFKPRCFGILVTSADVLTTCRCTKGEDDETPDSKTTTFVMVKPKTSLVWWDDDYKATIQVRPHDHCKRCNVESYNDVALLTIEVVNTIYGIVETIPWSLLLRPKEEQKMTSKEIYSDCYILTLVKGFDTPSFGTLELGKREFTVWDSPGSGNDLRTLPIYGTSYRENSTAPEEVRFPGVPLMCRRNQTYVPVGVHIGGLCLGESSVSDLVASCRVKLVDCADCLPQGAFSTLDSAYCQGPHHVEIVLQFNTALYDWIDDHTIEPTRQGARRREYPPPETSNLISPLSFTFYVSIFVFLRLAL